MAKNEDEILQICGECKLVVGSFKVKPENRMLLSKEHIWCPHCQTYTRELRDVAARAATTETEKATYPRTLQWS